jgi:hypothetical protein
MLQRNPALVWRRDAKRNAREDVGFCDCRLKSIELIVGNYHFVSDVIADYFRSDAGLGVVGLMLSQDNPSH